jgi:hypothetical protein
MMSIDPTPLIAFAAAHAVPSVTPGSGADATHATR